MYYTFEKLREIYGADHIGSYLNTPANGLMRQDVEEKVDAELRTHLMRGSLGFMYFIEELFPKVKQKLAQFINSKPEHVALMPNFSFAHLALLSGIPKSTKIALLQEDYPSIFTPFEQGGYDITLFSISREGLDYDRFADFLSDSGAEVLALSHVQFLSGYKLDLKKVSEICKYFDVHIMLDVTQSIGYAEIDVIEDQIDVVAGSCYKWLNAGYGTGFMSVSDRFQERFKARMGGFMSYRLTENGNLTFENSITNYEPGHLNPENYGRLLHCLEEKTTIGVPNVEQHNKGLLQYALERLKQEGIKLPDDFQDHERGSFARVPGDESLLRELETARIYTAYRGGFIRFGCHLYNNNEDVDRFLETYLSLTGNT